MIPASVGAVIGFALFVVPGITFELLRQRRRPPFDQTALEEAARIVLSSVGFSGAASFGIALANWVHRGFFVVLADAGKRGLADYLNYHPRLVIQTVAVEVALATLLALVCHRSLSKEPVPDERRSIARFVSDTFDRAMRQSEDDRVSRFPVWWTLFHHTRPDGAETWLTVRKKDGTGVTGKLAAYDFHGPQDQRDVALQQPIWILREGWREPVALDPQWLLFVIPATEVSEVMVTYPPTDSST